MRSIGLRILFSFVILLLCALFAPTAFADSPIDDAAPHPQISTNAVAIRNLTRDGARCLAKGDYAGAKSLLQQALHLCETEYPTNSPLTGVVLNDLGNACRGLGDYTNALIYMNRSLAICENAAKPNPTNIVAVLNSVSFVYLAMDDFARAKPALQRSLAICEKDFGLDNLRTAMVLIRLADIDFVTSQFAEAEPRFLRVLSIFQNQTGPEKPNPAYVVNKLVIIYKTQGQDGKAADLRQQFADVPVGLVQKLMETSASGRYCLRQNDFTQAEKLFQQALSISRDDIRTNQIETALRLGDLATLYENMGQFDRAEPLFQEALDLHEKVLGPRHFRVATALNNLANVCLQRHEFARAESLFQRALDIDESMLGPNHPDTAACLNNEGMLYLYTKDYDKAGPLLERALSIDEKVLGPEQLGTATCLAALATLYENTGKYDQAETNFQRVLTIRERHLGREHADTLGVLFRLASLYNEMTDFSKAEFVTKEIQDRSEKVISRDDVNSAGCLCKLAALYSGMGNSAKAEELYRNALRIDEKIFDPADPHTVTTLNSFGEVCLNQGDFAGAEPLFQRALHIGEQIDQGDNAYMVFTLNCLAAVRRGLGDFAGAAPFYERALKIDEKIFGAEHLETAITLNNFAGLYGEQGNYFQARQLYERSLRIREKIGEARDPGTAITMHNLASTDLSLADYASAEELLQKARALQEKLLRPENPDLALTIAELGHFYYRTGDYSKAEPLYQQALTIQTKALGPGNPRTMETLMGLSLLYLDMNRADDAAALDAKWQDAHIAELANVLSFASEQQRLSFQERANPYATSAAVTNATELTLAILRNKGVVLDSLLEDRAVARAGLNQANRYSIDELSSAKQKLTQFTLSVPADTSEQTLRERSRERQELTAQVEQLESALAQNVAGLGRSRRALAVTVGQVQAAIPPDAALIEIVRYPRFMGKENWEQCYGAAVVAQSGEPGWISLGNASAIERDVREFQEAVRAQAHANIRADLHSLHQRVWAPIDSLLPHGTRTVIICPDAALNYLSFATLLTDDDRFLAEKYSIRYVASGRDLLRQPKPSSNSNMVIFADPDFTAGEPVGHSTAALKLVPLPYFATNAVELAAQAKKWNWLVRTYRGSDATEARLRALRSPRILHLSTHGFFLPQTIRPHMGFFAALTSSLFGDSDAPQKNVVLQNPMYRSGIALAGAQTTLDAWSRGEIPPTDNDGILTAEEAADLQLDNTWLVTLSACDTGVGQWVSGEGVMGLRRGFVQAGAQNLLITLWPVYVRTSGEFMLDFYSAVHDTGNAPKALADVQREWLTDLRKTEGVPNAVISVGPFILTSQGPIQ